MVAFGVAVILFRGWISDRADAVAGRQRTEEQRRRYVRVFYLPAALAFAMAAFVLFAKFD
jgi:hypothetical protein